MAIELAVQTITRDGLLAVFSSADVTGNSFQNSGVETVLIKNGSGGVVIVTLVITDLTDGQAVVNRTVTLADGDEQDIGPFPAAIYNDSLNPPLVTITFDIVTSVTLAVKKVGA